MPRDSKSKNADTHPLRTHVDVSPVDAWIQSKAVAVDGVVESVAPEEYATYRVDMSAKPGPRSKVPEQ